MSRSSCQRPSFATFHIKPDGISLPRLSLEDIASAVKMLVDFWRLLEKACLAMVARWSKERGSREIAYWRLRLLTLRSHECADADASV
jgi:hypothetical protein